MTATTASVRFSADGAAKVQSYVRLTASTYIHCCTYDDAAPILTIQDGPADITITNPGQGEVTEEDVRFGRQLAEAVTRYAAELERLAAKEPHGGGRPTSPPGRRRDGSADEGGAARAGTSGRPWVLSRMHERGDQSMRRVVTGEELAQLQNPNPFAMPRWRAPVYRTPLGIILAAKFARLLWQAGPDGRPASAGRQRPGPGRGDLGRSGLGHPRGPGPGRRRHAGRVAVVLAGLVLPAGRPTGPGQVAHLVLPAPLGRRHDHRRGSTLVSGPDPAARAGQGRPRPGTPTG